MEQEFPLETSRPEKRRLPFPDVPLPQEILHWKDTKSRFHLLLERTSRKLLVHGKQPVVPAVTKTDSFHGERNLNID